MSEIRRYILWNSPTDRDFDRIVNRSQNYDPIQVREISEAQVVLLTEADIRELLPLTNGQALIPNGILDPIGFPAPGAFRLSLDVPLGFFDSAGRRNTRPGPATFDRSRAEALIGADAVRNFARDGTRKVNVVVVDGGMDHDYIRHLGHVGPPGKIGPPFDSKVRPHLRPSRRHANGVARNVLAIDRGIKLVDAAILPERIDDIDLFAWNAVVPVLQLAKLVQERPEESWVVVCAWGLLDRKYDRALGTYAESRGHLLSILIEILVSLNVDVVFSAGNNGAFWPDVRSGHTDRGPFRSIFGSNGLSSVLTVGGVDATGAWIGESAQGPEPAGLRLPDQAANPRKPDVCVPTWFREDGDRHAITTGTSGACGLAAGIVACIRRRIGPKDLSPADLIDAIRATARIEGYSGGSTRATPAEFRLGSGILDGAALAAFLGTRFRS